MAKRAMVEGSIRDIGMATLGVDKVTKARLKRLAGDKPLVVKVRELVELGEQLEDANGEQVPLPGQESLVSQMPATKGDISRLNQILALSLVLPGVMVDTPEGVLKARDITAEGLAYYERLMINRLRALPSGIRAAIVPKAIEILNSVRGAVEQERMAL